MSEVDRDGARLVLVLTTLPDAASATSLVERLVEERLVACGNLLPGLSSIYRWDGEVQREAEVLVILKTTGERLPDLMRRGDTLHPYDVPEFVALDPLSVADAYRRWVVNETTAGAS